MATEIDIPESVCFKKGEREDDALPSEILEEKVKQLETRSHLADIVNTQLETVVATNEGGIFFQALSVPKVTIDEKSNKPESCEPTTTEDQEERQTTKTEAFTEQKPNDDESVQVVASEEAFANDYEPNTEDHNAVEADFAKTEGSNVHALGLIKDTDKDIEVTEIGNKDESMESSKTNTEEVNEEDLKGTNYTSESKEPEFVETKERAQEVIEETRPGIEMEEKTNYHELQDGATTDICVSKQTEPEDKLSVPIVATDEESNKPESCEPTTAEDHEERQTTKIEAFTEQKPDDDEGVQVVASEEAFAIDNEPNTEDHNVMEAVPAQTEESRVHALGLIKDSDKSIEEVMENCNKDESMESSNTNTEAVDEEDLKETNYISESKEPEFVETKERAQEVIEETRQGIQMEEKMNYHELQDGATTDVCVSKQTEPEDKLSVPIVATDEESNKPESCEPTTAEDHEERQTTKIEAFTEQKPDDDEGVQVVASEEAFANDYEPNTEDHNVMEAVPAQTEESNVHALGLIKDSDKGIEEVMENCNKDESMESSNTNTEAVNEEDLKETNYISESKEPEFVETKERAQEDIEEIRPGIEMEEKTNYHELQDGATTDVCASKQTEPEDKLSVPKVATDEESNKPESCEPTTAEDHGERQTTKIEAFTEQKPDDDEGVQVVASEEAFAIDYEPNTEDHNVMEAVPAQTEGSNLHALGLIKDSNKDIEQVTEICNKDESTESSKTNTKAVNKEGLQETNYISESKELEFVKTKEHAQEDIKETRPGIEMEEKTNYLGLQDDTTTDVCVSKQTEPEDKIIENEEKVTEGNDGQTKKSGRPLVKEACEGTDSEKPESEEVFTLSDSIAPITKEIMSNNEDQEKEEAVKMLENDQADGEDVTSSQDAKCDDIKEMTGQHATQLLNESPREIFKEETEDESNNSQKASEQGEYGAKDDREQKLEEGASCSEIEQEKETEETKHSVEIEEKMEQKGLLHSITTATCISTKSPVQTVEHEVKDEEDATESEERGSEKVEYDKEVTISDSSSIKLDETAMTILDKEENQEKETEISMSEKEQGEDEATSSLDVAFEGGLQEKNHHGECNEPEDVKTKESKEEDNEEIKLSVETPEKMEQQRLTDVIPTDVCISTHVKPEEETTENEVKNDEEAIENDDGQTEKSGSPMIKEVCAEVVSEKPESEEGIKLSDSYSMALDENDIERKDEDQGKEKELYVSDKGQGDRDVVTSSQNASSEHIKDLTSQEATSVTCFEEAHDLNTMPKDILKEEAKDTAIDSQEESEKCENGVKDIKEQKPEESVNNSVLSCSEIEQQDTEEIKPSVETEKKTEDQGMLHAIMTDTCNTAQAESQVESAEHKETNEEAIQSDDGRKEESDNTSVREICEELGSEKLFDTSSVKQDEKEIAILSKVDDQGKEHEPLKGGKDQGEEDACISTQTESQVGIIKHEEKNEEEVIESDKGQTEGSDSLSLKEVSEETGSEKVEYEDEASHFDSCSMKLNEKGIAILSKESDHEVNILEKGQGDDDVTNSQNETFEGGLQGNNHHSESNEPEVVKPKESTKEDTEEIRSSVETTEETEQQTLTQVVPSDGCISTETWPEEGTTQKKEKNDKEAIESDDGYTEKSGIPMVKEVCDDTVSEDAEFEEQLKLSDSSNIALNEAEIATKVEDQEKVQELYVSEKGKGGEGDVISSQDATFHDLKETAISQHVTTVAYIQEEKGVSSMAKEILKEEDTSNDPQEASEQNENGTNNKREQKPDESVNKTVHSSSKLEQEEYTEDIKPRVETDEKETRGFMHSITSDVCISTQIESFKTIGHDGGHEEVIEKDDFQKENSGDLSIKEACEENHPEKVESEGVELPDNSDITQNEKAIAILSEDADQEREQELNTSEQKQGEDTVANSQDTIATSPRNLQEINYESDGKEPEDYIRIESIEEDPEEMGSNVERKEDVKHQALLHAGEGNEHRFIETRESIKEDKEVVRTSDEIEERIEHEGLCHVITTEVCIPAQTQSQEETTENEVKNEESIESGDGQKEKLIVPSFKEDCRNNSSEKAESEGVKPYDSSNINLNEKAIEAFKDDDQEKDQEVYISAKGQGKDHVTSSENATLEEDLQEKKNHDEGNEPGFVNTRESIVEDAEEIQSSVETKSTSEQQGSLHVITTDVCSSTQTDPKEETKENEEKNDVETIENDDGQTKKSGSPLVEEVCEVTGSEKAEFKGVTTLSEDDIVNKTISQEKEQEPKMSEVQSGGHDVISTQNASSEDIKETTSRGITVPYFEEGQGMSSIKEIVKEEAEDKSINAQEEIEQSEISTLEHKPNEEQKGGQDEEPKEQSTDLNEATVVESQEDIMRFSSLANSTEDTSNSEKAKVESENLQVEDLEPVSEVKILEVVSKSEDSNMKEECLISSTVTSVGEEKGTVTKETSSDEKPEQTTEIKSEHPSIVSLDAISIEKELGRPSEKECTGDGRSVEDFYQESIVDETSSMSKPQETKEEDIKQTLESDKMKLNDTNREAEALEQPKKSHITTEEQTGENNSPCDNRDMEEDITQKDQFNRTEDCSEMVKDAILTEEIEQAPLEIQEEKGRNDFKEQILEEDHYPTELQRTSQNQKEIAHEISYSDPILVQTPEVREVGEDAEIGQTLKAAEDISCESKASSDISALKRDLEEGTEESGVISGVVENDSVDEAPKEEIIPTIEDDATLEPQVNLSNLESIAYLSESKKLTTQALESVSHAQTPDVVVDSEDSKVKEECTVLETTEHADENNVEEEQKIKNYEISIAKKNEQTMENNQVAEPSSIFCLDEVLVKEELGRSTEHDNTKEEENVKQAPAKSDEVNRSYITTEEKAMTKEDLELHGELEPTSESTIREDQFDDTEPQAERSNIMKDQILEEDRIKKDVVDGKGDMEEDFTLEPENQINDSENQNETIKNVIMTDKVAAETTEEMRRNEVKGQDSEEDNYPTEVEKTSTSDQKELANESEYSKSLPVGNTEITEVKAESHIELENIQAAEDLSYLSKASSTTGALKMEMNEGCGQTVTIIGEVEGDSIIETSKDETTEVLEDTKALEVQVNLPEVESTDAPSNGQETIEEKGILDSQLTERQILEGSTENRKEAPNLEVEKKEKDDELISEIQPPEALLKTEMKEELLEATNDTCVTLTGELSSEKLLNELQESDGKKNIEVIVTQEKVAEDTYKDAATEVHEHLSQTGEVKALNEKPEELASPTAEDQTNELVLDTNKTKVEQCSISNKDLNPEFMEEEITKTLSKEADIDVKSEEIRGHGDMPKPKEKATGVFEIIPEVAEIVPEDREFSAVIAENVQEASPKTLQEKYDPEITATSEKIEEKIKDGDEPLVNMYLSTSTQEVACLSNEETEELQVSTLNSEIDEGKQNGPGDMLNKEIEAVPPQEHIASIKSVDTPSDVEIREREQGEPVHCDLQEPSEDNTLLSQNDKKDEDSLILLSVDKEIIQSADNGFEEPPVIDVQNLEKNLDTTTERVADVVSNAECSETEQQHLNTEEATSETINQESQNEQKKEAEENIMSEIPVKKVPKPTIADVEIVNELPVAKEDDRRNYQQDHSKEQEYSGGSTYQDLEAVKEQFNIEKLSDNVEKDGTIDIQDETTFDKNLQEEETEERTNITETIVNLHHRSISTEAAVPIEDVKSSDVELQGDMDVPVPKYSSTRNPEVRTADIEVPPVMDATTEKVGYNKDPNDNTAESYEAKQDFIKDVHLESKCDRSKTTEDISGTKQEPLELIAPVTPGTAATEDLEISQKYVTDALIQINEVSASTVDKESPNKAHENESIKSKLLVGTIDASHEQGEPTAKSLNAGEEILEATNVLGTEPQCSSEVVKEDKKTSDEKEKSEPTEILFTDMLHESIEGNSVMAKKLTEGENSPTKDHQVDKEETGEDGVIAGEDNEEEEEDDEDNQKMGTGSDAPVMVEASKDMEVKAHKKSHNILSGVGSKVKHSIAKVKKAITGKSSHSKPPSPKEQDQVIT